MSDLKPIIPNPGAERDPSNFVGRADSTQHALDMLEAKQNILLSDPRRMGKTFWMQTFAHQLNEGKQYKAVFVDYQGVNSIEEFLTKTARELSNMKSLPNKFSDRLPVFFENIDASLSLGPLTLKETVRASGKTPIEVMEEILTLLDHDLGNENKKTMLVIIMDEVSDAVLSIAEHKGESEAKNLLKRLRHLRSNTNNIRWIIAGSIGFHHVQTIIKASSDVINDLSNLRFGPLTKHDAELLAKRLALGINRPISDEALESVVTLTDAFPSLIQKLFGMMRYESDGSSAAERPIEASEVEQKLSDFIDDRDQSQDVTHYVTRIDQYYGNNTDIAQKILDYLAQSTEQVSFEDIRATAEKALGSKFENNQLVAAYNNLLDDHYLVEQRADSIITVTWKYPILKRIYTRRRMLG